MKCTRNIYAGIDIGSITSKAALISEGSILGTHTLLTGYDHLSAGAKVFDLLISELKISSASIKAVVSTGYGRSSVKFADRALSEIICHGAGAFFQNRKIRGIIDVGGQDSKAISLDSSGVVENFAMNDKCAAGTGRFLEVMARALELEPDQLGNFDAQADRPAEISSICTVFAESEVISKIANQETRENIIAGIHESAAARIAILTGRIRLAEPVMMTGGVAKNKGMVRALERRLGYSLVISDYPQENGAIGAAVMASRL